MSIDRIESDGHNDKCLHPERWAEVQIKMAVLQESINDKFRNVQSATDDMRVMLRDMHDRLFIDNGNPSVQTRLQRVEAAVSGMISNTSDIEKLKFKMNMIATVSLLTLSAVVGRIVHYLFGVFER